MSTCRVQLEVYSLTFELKVPYRYLVQRRYRSEAIEGGQDSFYAKINLLGFFSEGLDTE